MKNKVIKIFEQIQQYSFVQAMRRGLIGIIPILMIGSFSTLFSTFPVDAYITFITTWCNGFLYNLFGTVQKMTMGMASVYMAGLIGYHMGIMNEGVEEKKYGTMLVSLGSFFLLSGAVKGDNTALGAQGMLVAMVSAGAASKLYLSIAKRIKSRQLLADGADMNLRSAIYTIFPALCSFSVIALANNVLLSFTQKESFYEWFLSLVGGFFEKIGNGFGGGLSYELINTVLWFLGIHGSDVLEGAAEKIFSSAIEQNMALAQNGQVATEIITRQFINSYTTIGGCGATLCLLIALLLFSKRRGTRNLMKWSVLPILFNINEILVFGLPIIYNPVFLVPFLLVPVVNYSIAYFATYMGWVPVATADIPWTTPIFINGYLSTGTWRGVVLQLIVLFVGVAIYSPFVKLYDRKKEQDSKTDYGLMLEKLKESEASRTPIKLTDSAQSFGWMGKALAADLEYAFAHDELKMFYQPQYNDEDKCIGAEALLRWEHRTLGWIYPPLILKLAEEMGIREELERWVVLSVIGEAHMLQEKYPDFGLKLSVNVTGASIQQKSFEAFLEHAAAQNDIKKLNICIEITEQDALLLDETLRERFFHLRQLGYTLAVDDFSMGSTSIGYLTDSHFGLVKLDGSLVKGVLDNPRCAEIIASIIHLSDSLNVQVLAEYVSDLKIREKLSEVGCRLYQGWYYSPAVPLGDFEKILEKEEK